LAEALEGSGKISADAKKKIADAENFNQVRYFLWEQFFAVDYYLARKSHGWTPDFLKELKISPAKDA